MAEIIIFLQNRFINQDVLITVRINRDSESTSKSTDSRSAGSAEPYPPEYRYSDACREYPSTPITATSFPVVLHLMTPS